MTSTGAMEADPADLAPVHAGIAAYYSAKVAKYGATPLGVDWSCVPTQELRFVQLLKLCDFGSPFSFNDLGCGYGALIAYLDRRHAECAVDYLGIDLSEAMLRRARRLYVIAPTSRSCEAMAARGLRTIRSQAAFSTSSSTSLWPSGRTSSPKRLTNCIEPAAGVLR